jgi:hypothetical protein
MIRSVLVVGPTAVRAALCLATVAAISAAANAAGPRGNQAGLTGYSMTPSGPTDHYVAGKYDKTGTYIPPHYQPVSKPPFHGYFFKKKLGDTTGGGPMGITAKSH